MRNLAIVKNKFFQTLSAVGLFLLSTTAQAAVFEKNELRIVMTPDYFPVIWMNADKYSVDFTYDGSQVVTCGNFCPAEAIAEGVTTYRTYIVNQYVTVTVYYDLAGNIVGTSATDNTPPPPPLYEASYYGPFDVGSLQGEFSVSPSGSATYSLGIDVPPGVNGMQPQVGVSYDSQGGNGLMGMGWGIGGLSEITRCPKTLIDDGFVHGVDFTSSDAFCLDGQRLVNVNGEYRLRNSDSIRVIYSGNAFFVHGRDGSVTEYGVSADSNIKAQGKTETRVWAINKVTDKFNNSYSYTYYKDENYGIYRITGITYANGTASIDFEYEDRPDTVKGYQAGSLYMMIKRLKYIKVNHQDYTAPVSIYKFFYEFDVSSVNPSRLSAIQKCNGTKCLKPVDFSWNTQAQGFNGGNVAINSSNAAGKTVYSYYGRAQGLVDVSGDGIADRAWVPDGSSEVWVAKGSANGFQAATLWMPTNAGGVSNVSYYYLDENFVDVDGDGKLDRVWKPDGTHDIWVAKSTGNAFSTPQRWITEGEAGVHTYSQHSSLYSYQDMNGDGRTDRVWVPYGTNQVWVALSTGNDFATPVLWLDVDPNFLNLRSWYGKYNKYADVNGDGLTDWVWMPDNHHEWWVALSTGTGLKPPERWLADTESAVHVFSSDALNENLVDVNADGLPDRVWRPNGRYDIWVALSTGTRFATPELWLAAAAGGVNVYSVEGKYDSYYDVNADGYADKVWIPDGRDDMWVSLSDGTKFLTPSLFMTKAEANNVNLSSNEGYRNFAGDINGDGSVDIFWMPDGSTTEFYSATSNAITARIESIEDGVGLVRNISYKPLTDNSVYTRGIWASYPYQDIQYPQYVVSQQSTTDGLDGAGTTDIAYQYSGARVHLQGHGQLGFFETVSTNLQTGLETTVTYYQSYPYVGRVRTELQVLNGNVLSSVENFPAQHDLGNGRVLPYTGSSVTRSYDINGNHLSTVTSVNQINGNTQGNITDSIVTTQDANDATETYVTYAHNDYGHSASGNFYLESRVTQNSLYKSGPVGTSPTVYQSFVFSPTHYRLMSETGWVDDGSIHNGLSKAYTYDSFGHINSTTVSGPDIETRIAETHYDASGLYPVEVINEMGHVAKITAYDAALGVPLAKEDVNGLVTSYQYDEWGRATDTYAPGGNVTHTTQAWCSLNCTLPAVNGSSVAQTAKFIVTSSVTGGVNSSEQYMPDVVTYYDKLGREIRKQTTSFDGLVVLQDTAYDNLGRVVASTQPYFAGDSKVVSTTSYDALNRPVSTYSPAQGTSTVSFNGFLTTTQVQAFNPVTNSVVVQLQSERKNVIGQVLENTDNDGNVLSYEYDAQGNKVKTFLPKLDAAGNIIDPVGTVIEIQYDVFGRKNAMIDPNMGSWSYTYDSSSKLISQTDGMGQVTTMEYDRMGRMTRRTDHDGTESHWVYNDDLRNGDNPSAINRGKLQSVYMLDATSFELYRQDYTYTLDLGLADTSTTTIEEGDVLNSQRVSYTSETDYDRFHRPEIVTYPQTVDSMRLSIKYQYLNGVLKAVKSADDTVTYWELDAKDASGSVTAASLRNGAINVLSDFDDAGRLVYLNYNTGALIYHSTYQYDELGNLVSRDSQRGDLASTLSQQYYYDTLNRLTSVTINGVANAQQYSYDVLGNLRSNPVVGSIGYLNSRPNAVNQVNGQAAFTYTNNGGLLAGDGKTVTWTAFNKPASIAKGSAESVFKYGPNRARYYHLSTDSADPSKDSLTYYVGGSLEKVTVNGVTKYKQYIQAGGQSVAQYTVYKDAQNQVVEKTEYLLRDYQGSTVAVIDNSGSVASQLDYDTFGRRQPILGASVIDSIIDSIPRGYTGHEHLDKLGLIHMNGRVYDPMLGRFLSADPIIQFSKNMQSYNRYSYVLNNPMSYTDPSGFSLKRLVKNTRRAVGKQFSVGLKLTVAGQVMYGRTMRRFFLKYEWARIALQVGAGIADRTTGCIGCFSASASAYLTEISGGSYGDIGKAAIIAGVSSNLSNGVQGNIGVKFLAKGAIGGLSARASGGHTGYGFWSGALGALGPSGNTWQAYVFGTIWNGAVAEITGRSFREGFISSLYNRMFMAVGTQYFRGRNGNVEKELEGMGEEEKASNFKRNYNTFKNALKAIGSESGLDVPENITVLDSAEMEGYLAGVRCGLFSCGDTVYVSRQYLQTAREADDFLITAYHEVLHFNDSFFASISPGRHDEIYAMESPLSFGGRPNTVERNIYDEFHRLQSE